jgi:hypothetical protein
LHTCTESRTALLCKSSLCPKPPAEFCRGSTEKDAARTPAARFRERVEKGEFYSKELGRKATHQHFDQQQPIRVPPCHRLVAIGQPSQGLAQNRKPAVKIVLVMMLGWGGNAALLTYPSVPCQGWTPVLISIYARDGTGST